MKSMFPKWGISPKESDYCDTFAEVKKVLSSLPVGFHHMHQSRRHTSTVIHRKESLLNSYNALLHEYRMLAASEREENVKSISISQGFYHALFSSPGIENSLKSETLQDDPRSEFHLAIDFQMSKLLPHLGETAQPGKIYHYQKLGHDILGILNLSTSFNMIYLTDETIVGDKTSDHVLSCLSHFAENYMSRDAQFLKIYLDPRRIIQM